MVDEAAPEHGVMIPGTCRPRSGKLIFLGGLSCLLATGLHAGQNLAPNSSFEQGLTSWSLWHEPGARAEAIVSTNGSRHGNACAEVRPGGMAVLHSIPIPVRGNTDYTLSAYVRTRGATDAGLSLWMLADEKSPTQPWDPDGGPDSAKGNLLSNGDFEDGKRSWQLWHGNPGMSSGGIVAEGRGAGHAFHVLNAGTQGANLHSDPVRCEPGTAYTLTVHAKVRSGKGIGIGVWAKDATGKTLSYAVGDTLELPAEVPEFRRFAVTIIAPPGSAELKAHLTCNGGDVWWNDCRLVPQSLATGYEVRNYLDLPADQPAWARFKHMIRTPPACHAMKILFASGGGEVRWDAVQLEAGRDTTPYACVQPPSGANRLPNSGFEDGNGGWTFWRQTPGQSDGGIEEACGRNGGHAFHVHNVGAGGANLHSDPIPCPPGATVTVSAFARVRGGKGVRLAAWALDGEGRTLNHAIDGHAALPDDVPDYTRLQKTVVAPKNAAGIKAHLICNGGDVWWDDVQIEHGAPASNYTPGPRCDILRPTREPAAVDYTRAIIREAQLRDVLAQTERLAAYASPADQTNSTALLIAARAAVYAVTQALGASYLVPPYRAVDYANMARLADSAAGKLASLWRELGYDPAQAFAPWDPAPLPDNADREQLAREFLIFPCFTRPGFFQGDGSWDVLTPFHFRLVSGWWGIGCDGDGTPRTEGIAPILSLCREHGYPCDIIVDPAGAAASALGGGEELFLHNAEGGWSPGGNCHNTVSIWHPDIRRLAALFAERVAARFASEPAVLCYEMTNEPSLTIERHEHGYHYRPAGVGGYEPPAIAAWHTWLEARHGNLAQLNRRWRTAHIRFADIIPPADLRPPPPSTGKAPVDTGPLYDFQTFRAESHAAWFRLCIEAFRRGDPRKALISQFVSPPIERRDAAVDLRALTEEAPWDIYGTHDWPGDRPASGSLYAVSMNRRARRPHWEDEFIWSQWERKGTPEPIMRAALERNLWRQIAWGKRGISLFNLESEWDHDSPKNWNNSLLNLEADLAIPRYCTGVIPTIERKVNRFKDILYATELGPAEVAILRPATATLVAAPDGRARTEGTAVAEFLLRRHCLPLLIPEEHIDGRAASALRGVRFLVAPWATHVPVAVQERLLAWVRAGGALACSGPFGLFDEYGAPAGHLLRAAFGDLDWAYDRDSARWQSLPKATDPSGFRSTECGAGRVLLSAEPFANPEQQDALAALQATMAPVPLVSADVPDIEILPRQGAADEMFLFVVNLSAREQREGALRVRGRFNAVTELTSDCRPEVPVAHAGGTTRIPLRLAPGTAVFLRLGRPIPPGA
ncbi:MAG TPA: beta-galactosidase [Verrucomicrobiae bacterium]|nr:beta-galactosidase [Verrucomicrobiae bacterium]